VTPIRFHAFTDSSGRLQIPSREAFLEALRAHPDLSGEIIFQPYHNGISNRQRRYFYGVVVEVLHGFFLSTGVSCSKQDVVEMLKDKFMFREKLCPITSRYVKVPISLSANDGAMTKEEFQDKKEAIQRWAAEVLSVDVPNPSEVCFKEPKS